MINANRRNRTQKILAGEGGFEPPHTDPESAVLPLDDSPAHHYVGKEILAHVGVRVKFRPRLMSHLSRLKTFVP